MNFKAMATGMLDAVLLGGFALGLVALTGCGSSGSGGGTTASGALAAGGATNLYAIQIAASGYEVLQFATNKAGASSPVGTLDLPVTLEASALATDSAGNLFVGGNTTDTLASEILVYGPNATGTTPPIRTILIDPNYDITMSGMTVDGMGKIYVTGFQTTGDSFGMVEVFPSGATGTVTPQTALTSSSLTGPVAVAVDTTGKIYVSNIGETNGNILVFAAGATSADAPVLTISSPAATATSASIFYGLAVDGSGNIFAVLDSGTFDSSGNETSASGAIEEFAPGATTPTKTISGSAIGFTYAGELRVDSVGNAYVIAATVVNNADAFSLLGFGPSATGNATPGLTITSTALSNPQTALTIF